MNSKPAISVVIPLYNKAPYIERCVASIRAQTLTDFEVVVVDDGSTDSSFEDFERFTQQDSRFRILRQANGGVSRARNAAIAASHADWIAFLDADDEWQPEFLQSIVALADRNPRTVVIGTAFQVVQDGQRAISRQDAFGEKTLVNISEFFESWARLGNCPLFIGACAARRGELQAIGGFVPGMSLGEELLVFIRLLDRGELEYINRALAIYHLSATGSLSTSPSVAALRSHSALFVELARQVKLGQCPLAVYRKWLYMQADYLIHRGLRVDLLKLFWSEPGVWSAQMWLRAGLELIGVRATLSRLLGRSPVSS
jgi:glycosyltransferase involved in cell wall biosynthesis